MAGDSALYFSRYALTSVIPMKCFPTLSLLFATALSLLGSESMLTTTYQPLDGLGAGTIKIVPVTCHDWYGMSGQPSSIALISAANVPPTNEPRKATRDLNLASLCRLRCTCGDIETTRELTLEAGELAIPEAFTYPRDQVLRASLECLRRCLPEKLLTTSVTLKASVANKGWMAAIVKEFNAHDRRKVVFTPPE